jgi:hypothetical protein
VELDLNDTGHVPIGTGDPDGLRSAIGRASDMSSG